MAGASIPSSGFAAEQQFGARLRRIRAERGLRQLDLAGDNISASYISLLEADRRAPTDRIIKHLSVRLGCDPEELRAPTPKPAHRSADVDLKMARAAMTVGEYVRADSWYEQILSNHQELDTVRAAQFGRAVAAEHLGRLRDAVEWYERCYAAIADTTFAHRLGTLLGRARVLARSGDPARALAAATDARRHISEAGLDVSDAGVEIRAILATVLVESGDYAAAEEPIVEALDLCTRIADHQTLGTTYWVAGTQAYRLGHNGHSVELISRITEANTYDHGRLLGMLYAVYGSLLLRRAEPDAQTACQMLAAAVAELAGHSDAVRCRIELARALIMLHRLPDALAECNELTGLTGAAGDGRVHGRLLRANVLILQGLGDQAVAECRLVRAELEQRPRENRSPQLWSMLGEVLLQAGDSRGAIHAYQSAVG